MMESFLPQVFAQTINNKALPPDLINLSGTEFFGRLIPGLISFGLVIGVIFFVFYLIYGGIQWISSGGDKPQMEQARSKIYNAIIGIIVLLSFFAILNIVECFFGFGLRQLEVGPYNISFTSGLNCSGGGGGGGLACGYTPPDCTPLNLCCNTDSGTWYCAASCTD